MRRLTATSSCRPNTFQAVPVRLPRLILFKGREMTIELDEISISGFSDDMLESVANAPANSYNCTFGWFLGC